MNNDFKTNNIEFNNVENSAKELNCFLKNLDIEKITKDQFLQLLPLLQNTEDLVNDLERKYFLNN